MFKHESVRLGRVGSGWVGQAGQVGSGSSGWSGRLSRSGRSVGMTFTTECVKKNIGMGKIGH